MQCTDGKTFIIIINVKKLRFRHELTANDTSKTAKITKRWYYSAAHWHLGEVLVGNHRFVIFVVLDVSFAVNSCLNRSFFTFIVQVTIGKWSLVVYRAIIADFWHLGLPVLYCCLYLTYLSTNLHRSPWEFQSEHWNVSWRFQIWRFGWQNFHPTSATSPNS